MILRFFTAVALGAALLGTASAAGSVSVRAYLASLPRVISLSQETRNGFVLTYQQPTSYPLRLGTWVDSYTGGNGVNEINLFIPTDTLTDTQMTLLNEVALQFALRCFNIKAERKPTIAGWMNAQNAYGWRARTGSFGPLEIEYGRREIDGAYATLVTLRRVGTPGQAPWINYCTY